MAFLLFCGLFILLFFLSQKVTRLISSILNHLLKKQQATIYILSFLFLPGVVLHELSHLLIANLLLVPTGEVEFFPEVHGNQVKMGSVAIARTDPLRRFLIGVAPVIGGLSILLVASSYLLGALVSWQSLLLFYIVFQVSNTLFSSNKDMEGAIGFLVAAFLVCLLLQLVGVPILNMFLSLLASPLVMDTFARLNFFLITALGIDVFLVLLLEGLMGIFRRA